MTHHTVSLPSPSALPTSVSDVLLLLTAQNHGLSRQPVSLERSFQLYEFTRQRRARFKVLRYFGDRDWSVLYLEHTISEFPKNARPIPPPQPHPGPCMRRRPWDQLDDAMQWGPNEGHVECEESPSTPEGKVRLPDIQSRSSSFRDLRNIRAHHSVTFSGEWRWEPSVPRVQ